MRRFGACLGVLIILWLSIFTLTPAHAASDWVYSSYKQQVTLSKNGTATVVLDADLDFGTNPGHGPSLTFITRQKMNDGRYRLLDTEILSATSSTGASTKLSTKRTENTLSVRVGSENKSYTGVHHYTITYRILGLVTPNHSESSLDEFNWNAIGNAGNMAHKNVAITITGPDIPTKGACWQGFDYRTPCQASTEGEKVVLSTKSLKVGEPMQVVAGFPVGTFVNAEPAYYVPKTLADLFPSDPIQLAGAGTLALAGAGGVILLGRRGRDRTYAGVAPGNRPQNGQENAITFRDATAPVAVRFSPPDGVRPAEADYLMRQRGGAAQTSATLIDLAVRGYLKIEQSGENEFAFTRTTRSIARDESDLVAYELALLNGLFKTKNSVTTQQLKSGAHGPVDLKMKTRLTTRVIHQLNWFNRSPVTGLGLGIALGLAVVIGGIGLAVLLGLLAGLGWLGVAIALVGVAILTQARRFSHRTAEGSVALAQAEGFKLFISTADADQLKWEEGQDIFSAYLPWAIAFGEADRWTKIFQKLAADGRYNYEPTWFYSPYFSFWYANLWANSMNSFTDVFQDAIQQSDATAISGLSSAVSGFSGFKGGGGFGGGGSGGW